MALKIVMSNCTSFFVVCFPKFSVKQLQKQRRKTFLLLITAGIFLLFLIGECISRETSHEINLISQCDLFNITLPCGKSGTGDATRRKTTLSRGTNRSF